MTKTLNPKDWSFVTVSILLLALLGLTSAIFFNYDFPSGKEATLLSFIKIFSRELLILFVLAVFLFILLINKMKIIKTSRSNNA